MNILPIHCFCVFYFQIYTDKHHSLEGLNIHKHLYNLLTDFFKDKLKL
jgi:hypothetical protein